MNIYSPLRKVRPLPTHATSPRRSRAAFALASTTMLTAASLALAATMLSSRTQSQKLTTRQAEDQLVEVMRQAEQKDFTFRARTMLAVRHNADGEVEESALQHNIVTRPAISLLSEGTPPVNIPNLFPPPETSQNNAENSGAPRLTGVRVMSIWNEKMGDVGKHITDKISEDDPYSRRKAWSGSIGASMFSHSVRASTSSKVGMTREGLGHAMAAQVRAFPISDFAVVDLVEGEDLELFSNPFTFPSRQLSADSSSNISAGPQMPNYSPASFAEGGSQIDSPASPKTPSLGPIYTVNAVDFKLPTEINAGEIVALGGVKVGGYPAGAVGHPTPRPADSITLADRTVTANDLFKNPRLVQKTALRGVLKTKDSGASPLLVNGTVQTLEGLINTMSDLADYRIEIGLSPQQLPDENGVTPPRHPVFKSVRIADSVTARVLGLESISEPPLPTPDASPSTASAFSYLSDPAGGGIIYFYPPALTKEGPDGLPTHMSIGENTSFVIDMAPLLAESQGWVLVVSNHYPRVVSNVVQTRGGVTVISNQDIVIAGTYEHASNNAAISSSMFVSPNVYYSRPVNAADGVSIDHVVEATIVTRTSSPYKIFADASFLRPPDPYNPIRFPAPAGRVFLRGTAAVWEPTNNGAVRLANRITQEGIENYANRVPALAPALTDVSFSTSEISDTAVALTASSDNYYPDQVVRNYLDYIPIPTGS